MQYRPLGKTGMIVSTLGFGCGGFWGLSLFDERQAIALIHQAYDQGVTFFDTGASYSGGQAEVRLGKALKSMDSTKLVIGSKAGTVICKDGRLRKDFTQKSVFLQVENSLRNLGLEQLPLLQLHSPRLEDLSDDIFETLRLLKAQGKVRAVGASCDNMVLEKALSFNQLDVVMMTYNLIEKQAVRQLLLAHVAGCGILIKSPLCHTLYCNDIFKIRKLSDIWYLLRVLKNYRSQLLEGRKYHWINHDETFQAIEIALLYALHDKASCVVTGTTKPENLTRNVNTMNKKLSHELIEKINRVID
ncbi:MAG: aldo/keto reductase [Geobacteraceae bacterium]|nr:aldo/keto reductase [Geobacteraceae bacterium]